MRVILHLPAPLMGCVSVLLIACSALVLSGCASSLQPGGLANPACDVQLLVLGVAQDAGAPQMGRHDDPAWQQPSLRRLATSLALIDHRAGKRYLFEATPDIREQLFRLDGYARADSSPGLDGIFVTHAHIGHYVGLMFLGHESMGAQGVPVYAMPRMLQYLSSNGPWDQLVRLNNIRLHALQERQAVVLGEGLKVTPYRVPHRDEYSETVGFVIEVAGGARVLFVPDIDSWDRWERENGVRIEAMIRAVDLAYLDATFYDNNEIPGRDMSAIPHPRIAHMMERFASLDASQRAKIQFIHLNHSNPARYPESDAASAVTAAGYNLAQEMDARCLLTGGEP